MKKTNSSFFGQIPANIRHDKSITDTAKVLYCEISALLDNSGKCAEKNKNIAEALNVKLPALEFSLWELVHKKYISIYVGNVLNKDIMNDRDRIIVIAQNIAYLNTRCISVKPPKEKVKFKPPTIQEIEAFVVEKGYDKDLAIKIFDYYNAGDWKDVNGKDVKRWKQKIIGVWLKTESKINNTLNNKLTADDRFNKLSNRR